jgi:hypothetical protein
MSQRLPNDYLSHGGGPRPWISDRAAAMRVLATSLADIPRQLGRTPRALLVVTAH